MALLALALGPAPAAAGDALSIVGPAAVFPLTVAAAERFSAGSGAAMPLVERTGTEAGVALFCAGDGPRDPDIATAARRLSPAELGACSRQGIGVSELLLGYQSVVLAQGAGAPPLPLTRRQVFLALAREVPVNGQLAANPYRLWSDIDFGLPVRPILAAGPPPSSPLFDAFVELVLAPGAAEVPGLRGLSPTQRDALARRLRDDGAYAELDEDEAAMAARLRAEPGRLGVFSYNYLARNGAGLQVLALGGGTAGPATLADGSYPAARPIYLYVKRGSAGAPPALAGFLSEIVGEAAAGPEGYLAARGLVALPAPQRAALRQSAGSLPPM